MIKGELQNYQTEIYLSIILTAFPYNHTNNRTSTLRF